MATTNPITGDKLITKSTNDNYRDNYDKIFGKKKNVPQQEAAGDCEEESMSELRQSKRHCVCGSFESGS